MEGYYQYDELREKRPTKGKDLQTFAQKEGETPFLSSNGTKTRVTGRSGEKEEW